jgi:hypothetical protein
LAAQGFWRGHDIYLADKVHLNDLGMFKLYKSYRAVIVHTFKHFYD